MRGYIGVTDADWARQLAAAGATEVNFWLPSPDGGFRALQLGEPFLFKTHYPDNQIVGGGFFEHFAVLRASEAWEFLGTGNGARSLQEMVDRVCRYRRSPTEADPFIGCVILNEVVFFDPRTAPSTPRSFAKNIVRGKGYELPSEDSEAERAFEALLFASAAAGQSRAIPGPTLGTRVPVIPRLGQGGFQAMVLGAYKARCAVTGHRIRPTLQAAHIRPIAAGGQHRLDNGLLLRSDVHTMFDRGYLTIDGHHRLRVSPRLRQDFANGDEFYARDGASIFVPDLRLDRPNRDFLEWHQDSVFLAS